MKRRKKFSRLWSTAMLVGLMLSLTLVANAQELTIDFDFFPVAPEFQQPIQEALESGKTLLPETSRFTVSNLRMDNSGHWMHAVIVPTSVIESDWEEINHIIEFLAKRQYDGSWIGYVWGSEEYLTLLKEAPRDFIAISDVDLAGPSIALGRELPVKGDEYLFPWTKGQCWKKTQGWHSGYSLDFSPSGGLELLAAIGGKLTVVCSDNYQTTLSIDGKFRYTHVDTKSFKSNLEGQNIVRGQVLGVPFNPNNYPGEELLLPDGACLRNKNYCYQRYPNRQGLRYDTKCGYGTGMHVHFTLPSKYITIDGHNANDVANSAYNTPFCSSNVRVDNGGGTCCNCSGNNPVLNCTIRSGETCECRATTITLAPGFHAEQGSTVTLRP